MGVVFDDADESFVVSLVDSDGDAWTLDAKFCGIRDNPNDASKGWCVAQASSLEQSKVVKVDA